MGQVQGASGHCGEGRAAQPSWARRPPAHGNRCACLRRQPSCHGCHQARPMAAHGPAGLGELQRRCVADAAWCNLSNDAVSIQLGTAGRRKTITLIQSFGVTVAVGMRCQPARPRPADGWPSLNEEGFRDKVRTATGRIAMLYATWFQGSLTCTFWAGLWSGGRVALANSPLHCCFMSNLKRPVSKVQAGALRGRQGRKHQVC